MTALGVVWQDSHVWEMTWIPDREAVEEAVQPVLDRCGGMLDMF